MYVSLDVPARSVPPLLHLRLRLPRGERIMRVSLAGRPFGTFDSATATLDLSGLSGHLDLVVDVDRR